MIQRKETTTKTSPTMGLRHGERRATFVITEDTLLLIKAVAFWQRRAIKDVIAQALGAYLGTVPQAQLRLAVRAYKDATEASTPA